MAGIHIERAPRGGGGVEAGNGLGLVGEYLTGSLDLGEGRQAATGVGSSSISGTGVSTDPAMSGLVSSWRVVGVLGWNFRGVCSPHPPRY